MKYGCQKMERKENIQRSRTAVLCLFPLTGGKEHQELGECRKKPVMLLDPGSMTVTPAMLIVFTAGAPRQS